MASQNAIYSSRSGRKIRGQSAYYSNGKAKGYIGPTGLLYLYASKDLLHLAFSIEEAVSRSVTLLGIMYQLEILLISCCDLRSEVITQSNVLFLFYF